MRKLITVVFVVTSMALVATASPAAAAPPLDVDIVAEEMLPTNLGGTFTASGPAVDDGLICSSGDTTNDVIGPVHGTTSLIFTVDKTFHCDGAPADTFSLRLNVKLDPVTGETTARWRVIGSSGAYAGLKGHGSLVGTPPAGMVGLAITDVYDGKLK